MYLPCLDQQCNMNHSQLTLIILYQIVYNNLAMQNICINSTMHIFIYISIIKQYIAIITIIIYPICKFVYYRMVILSY